MVRRAERAGLVVALEHREVRHPAGTRCAPAGIDAHHARGLLAHPIERRTGDAVRRPPRTAPGRRRRAPSAPAPPASRNLAGGPVSSPFSRLSRNRPPAPALLAIASSSSTCFRDSAAPSARASRAPARPPRSPSAQCRARWRRRRRCIDDVEPVAQVRPVDAVALHRVGVASSGGTASRSRAPPSRHSATISPSARRMMSLASHERRLDVDLRELGLAVRAQVLVAEAARDLEVAVEARHHEQLLVELRRLRQRVELAGVHAARHEVVARALGRRLGEDRRLDLEEVRSRSDSAARALQQPMPQHQVVLQLGTAQVEIAMPEPQLLGRELLPLPRATGIAGVIGGSDDAATTWRAPRRRRVSISAMLRRRTAPTTAPSTITTAFVADRRAPCRRTSRRATSPGRRKPARCRRGRADRGTRARPGRGAGGPIRRGGRWCRRRWRGARRSVGSAGWWPRWCCSRSFGRDGSAVHGCGATSRATERRPRGRHLERRGHATSRSRISRRKSGADCAATKLRATTPGAAAASNAAQSLHVRAAALRAHQQKEQLHRLPIQRIEVHRIVRDTCREHQLVDVRRLAVRNGDAITNAGAQHRLALAHGFENRLRIDGLAPPSRRCATSSTSSQHIAFRATCQRHFDPSADSSSESSTCAPSLG